MRQQSILLLSLFSLLAFKSTEASPIFDTQIGEFIREFIFSGGTMDQDDEPFSLDFDPSETTDVKDGDGDAKDEVTGKKKVLVLSKDEEFQSDNPRVRSMKKSQQGKSLRALRSKRAADGLPQMTKSQVQKILEDIKSQSKDPKIQSRMFGDLLEDLDGTFMGSVRDSAMKGVRAFFREFLLDFFS